MYSNVFEYLLYTLPYVKEKRNIYLHYTLMVKIQFMHLHPGALMQRILNLNP